MYLTFAPLAHWVAFLVALAVTAVQIGDMRGLGGLVELLWHELEVKLGIYNVKVQPAVILLTLMHLMQCEFILFTAKLPHVPSISSWPIQLNLLTWFPVW